MRGALHQGFLPDGHHRSYVWKYSEPVGGRRPRHFHLEPEVNLVVAGSAVLGIGDRVLTATAGDLVAFPAGQDHALLEASPDLYLYAVGLDSAYSTRVLGAGAEPVPLHVRLDSAELAGVSRRAAELVDQAGAEQAGAELWDRVHWLGRRGAPRQRRGTHVLTRRVLERLSSAPELGLESLAQELSVHPSEVSRHFHRDLGVTLVRYRARLRVLHMIRSFDDGVHDLTTAASAAGFGSYSQCHRSFHAELGCAPRDFFFEGHRERQQGAYAP